MSHFTKLKIKLSDIATVNAIVKSMGWFCTYSPLYTNPYNGELVKDANIFRDSSDTIRMVTDSEGNVIVDAYYMGHEYKRFVQAYAKKLVVDSFGMEGGILENETAAKNGDIVLTYNFM